MQKMKTLNFYIDRALMYANYIIENEATITETAKHFCVSHSTVSSTIHKYLKIGDEELYRRISKVVKSNQGKGLRAYCDTNRLVVECECTTCKHNTSQKNTEVGHCTLSMIALKYKEIDLSSGEKEYMLDCSNFHFSPNKIQGNQ